MKNEQNFLNLQILTFYLTFSDNIFLILFQLIYHYHIHSLSIRVYKVSVNLFNLFKFNLFIILIICHFILFF